MRDCDFVKREQICSDRLRTSIPSEKQRVSLSYVFRVTRSIVDIRLSCGFSGECTEHKAVRLVDFDSEPLEDVGFGGAHDCMAILKEGGYGAGRSVGSGGHKDEKSIFSWSCHLLGAELRVAGAYRRVQTIFYMST